jgi:type II secretory pathway predicted ATPase ExeA
MLARELLRRLPSKGYDVAMLTNPRGSTIDFWRDVLWELGVETTETARPSLLRLVNDRLYRNYRAGRDTVIAIDEAQLIGDDTILEELRLLLNLQTDDRFLATILLVGSSALRARLGRLDHVAQRIAVRCHLAPFDLSRTEAYIGHRLRVAGLGQKIFADEAIRLVADLSGGAPRTINTLCDLALLIGYEELAVAIDANVVTAAARASQADAVGESGSDAEGTRPDGAPRDLRGDPPPPLDPGPRRYL